MLRRIIFLLHEILSIVTRYTSAVHPMIQRRTNKYNNRLQHTNINAICIYQPGTHINQVLFLGAIWYWYNTLMPLHEETAIYHNRAVVSKDVGWQGLNPLTDSRQGTLHTETSILRIKRPWRVKIRPTTDIFGCKYWYAGTALYPERCSE